MKSVKCIFLLVLCLMLTPILKAQSIVGLWKATDESGKVKSIVDVYLAKNGKYYGKIIKLVNRKSKKPICTKCTDYRKDKPVLGMKIITGLKKHGNVWKSGKILDPQNGKQYTLHAWVEGGELKLRGYWGVFYRTVTWTRKS